MPRVSKAAARERRARLIDVAQKEFILKGFDNTTIKNIIDQMGLSTGTFYYHFKSKEEILVAVSEKLIDEEVVKLNQIRDARDKTTACRIRSSLNVMYETFWQGKDIWKQILQTHNLALHRRIIDDAVSRISPLLATMLREGNEESRLNVPYPEEIAEIMISLLDFYVHQYSFSDDEVRKDRCLKALEHTLGLILGDDCRPAFSVDHSQKAPAPVLES